MAEFSFDVVSEFDSAELTNAIDQARREVGTRFDFKDTATSFELKSGEVIVESSSEDRAKAAYQVLVEKAARRNLSPKLFKPGEPKTVGKGRGQIEVQLNAGITDELAKDLQSALGRRARRSRSASRATSSGSRARRRTPSSRFKRRSARRRTSPSRCSSPTIASGVSGNKVDNGSAQNVEVELRGPGPSSSRSYGCVRIPHPSGGAPYPSPRPTPSRDLDA